MSTPNQLSDTPRTDAAWAKTFQDDEDQCRAGNAATDMRDECATLERELAALAAERDQLRAQLHALNLVCGTTDADKCQTWVDRAIARAERAEAESIQLKKTNVENADSYRLMQGRVIAAEVEVERLKARLYQGCDDERDMAISEGPGHSTCGLADELTARAERAEAERASERGRLDYLSTRGFEHRHHETGDHLGYEWTISSYSESEDVTLRDVIDAEMREDEK